jgi:hypothetical protein
VGGWGIETGEEEVEEAGEGRGRLGGYDKTSARTDPPNRASGLLVSFFFTTNDNGVKNKGTLCSSPRECEDKPTHSPMFAGATSVVVPSSSCGSTGC